MFQRIRYFWTPLRVADVVIVLAVIWVTVISLHPSLLVSSTTITGGDTGSHLALPAYLHAQGNIFNVTPWYPGWFAGMPAYTFYFPLADWLASLASYVINFAVAMKLATILGSVLMPVAAYVMGRLFKAPRPIPAALAMATLPFLFDASFTIDGGNLFSTMAGEYAFSLSLALSLVTIGLFARGVRTGRGYWWAALGLSATLAAHILPWFFAIGAVGVLVLFELMYRGGMKDPNDPELVRGDHARPLRFAIGAGLLSAGLSAWWLLPFGSTQKLTNSLGYINQPVNNFYQVFAQLGWDFRNPNTSAITAGGDRWVIVLAAIALVTSFAVRDRLGMVLGSLVLLSFEAYTLDPQSVILNERIVPFWFISIHLSAGWLFGYVFMRWTRRRRREPEWEVAYVEGENITHDPSDRVGGFADILYTPPPVPEGPLVLAVDDSEDQQRVARRTMTACLAVAVLGLSSVVPGLLPPVSRLLHLNTTGNQVSVWAQTNYSGYQAQSGWPEYHNIITTMDRVTKRYGCGRAMWEYNSDQQRFGTPEALMLLPYWTNDCVDSMEGLFFESSATTPYHFLDQAELSASPSDAQAGLTYGTLNVNEGVAHLEMLGVKYYLAFSPAVVAQANGDSQLQLVAKTKAWPAPGATWSIYLIKNSPLVKGLSEVPNVVANTTSRVGWLDANEKWWLNFSLWPTLAASSGPSNWPRAASVTSMTHTELPNIVVTHIVSGAQSLSFHVNRIGVPVLVKISYFPRWHATGANGPYRVSPNLMVVIPTAHDVTMVYGSSGANEWGDRISQLTAMLGLVTAFFAVRRWRRTRRVSQAS